MLQSLSLRMRLLLLLGAVLAAGLTLGVGVSILHAGARIRAEAEGATRLARELVDASAPGLAAAQDPRAALAGLVADVRRLRHLRVYIEGEAPPESDADRRAPRWFAALATPRESATRMATRGGVLVIEPNPADEIAEIWEDVRGLALGASGVAALAFALVSLVVSKTLRPVATLADGLQRLEQGDHGVRVAGGGSPELVAIAERINALAATLQRLDEENHRLVRRMLHVQDDERRDIARDLHDEIGPFLFTIRAGVGALARKSAPLAADCDRIGAQIAELQQVNRHILARLRPAALEEMGLAGALTALVEGWRDSHPQVAVALDIAGAEGEIDETTALTAYRVAQEGLTNVFRHAGATRVLLAVARETRDGAPALRVSVSDNGAGLGADMREGIGLRGMSERVGVLGGRLTLRSQEDGGARLEAALPLE
jgi:two-component system sensor histidine kinase UhpB